MTELVMKIYDWMAGHTRLCILSFVAVTLMLVVLVLRLDFREDISDFLPLDSEQQAQLKMYQDVSGASRVIAIFSGAEPDTLVVAVDRFVQTLAERDTARLARRVMAQADFAAAGEMSRFVYHNIPYFLTTTDYQRMDSLLGRDDYVASQLQADRELLLLPSGGLLSEHVRRDPLHLFTPVMSVLQQASAGLGFEVYEGYVFSSDMQQALVMIDSPFGNSETQGNARLLSLLQGCADAVGPPVSIRFTGGPVIAVGNASQIKADSLLSVSLAVVLILALLLFTFRRVRHLLLIAVAIGWGWLFALAGLSLIHPDVSLIVIGISSIILGIAVNYPLHLVAHLQHSPDVRTALREIARPLVVGNITTVGAFLALVPLQSVALRDLGLFSAFLLAGTICFVLLWMPQAMKKQGAAPVAESGKAILLPPNNSSSTLHLSPSTLLTLLTLFLAYHSTRTSFDTDLTHINYMTDEQRADMALLGGDRESTDAFDARFLLSDSIQRQRLRQWHDWSLSHRDRLVQRLAEEVPRAGFAEGSFDEFQQMLCADYDLQPLDYFRQLPPSLLLQNIDVKSLNATILKSLSDNFNYIGWACSLIVFFFLWFSFRSLFLAVVAFLPMAVSWLWILGIMALLDIQFNIVNVILATFIFGQGDDYTIFMTEGVVYETVHRRQMLASYRRAIILSALIMFIGIGSLIVARHPALHSLAEVTIVGMSSVVLMAFLLPPLLFGWYVRCRHLFR